MVFACNLLASAVALADSARNKEKTPKVRPLKEICRMSVRRLMCKGTLGKRLSELEIPEVLRAHLVGIPEYLSALNRSKAQLQER